ncbi:MAG: hypothetical protein R2720_04505 [Candidatus Nanopelagicales bacterium]
MFEFKMTGLNQKNLERLLTDAAEKPAKAFEAELNQRASHISTLTTNQAQSEVDRIARKHGINLNRESARKIADTIIGGGNITVTTD